MAIRIDGVNQSPTDPLSPSGTRIDVSETEGFNYAGSLSGQSEPSLSEVPDGWWGFWFDESNNVFYFVRRRGAALTCVELTPT